MCVCVIRESQDDSVEDDLSVFRAALKSYLRKPESIPEPKGRQCLEGSECEEESVLLVCLGSSLPRCPGARGLRVCVVSVSSGSTGMAVCNVCAVSSIT